MKDEKVPDSWWIFALTLCMLTNETQEQLSITKQRSLNIIAAFQMPTCEMDAATL